MKSNHFFTRSMPVGDTTTIAGRKRQSGGRSESTVRRLKMQKEVAIHDEKGNIIFERFHSTEATGDGRIEANRKWFGNTRVVGQTELDQMRELIDKEKRPNQFLMRSAKLPTSLIRDIQPEQIRLEEIEPFDKTFGPKAQRRRAKLDTQDPELLIKQAQEEANKYDHKNDWNTVENQEKLAEAQKNAADPKLTRGATKRVYSEIYKVIDSCDVLIYVLDARDPNQTRSQHVEQYLRLPENEHRHLIYVLNKIDLVPLWATKSWIQQLSLVHPTIAYNAAARRPFGKAELISVLRQFSHLHKDKPNMSVGFLGYPNVGKSSVINSLIGKESCKVAPVPGETKVWQYVNLTKKIFLVDAPGVVFPGAVKLHEQGTYGEDVKLILAGVIRIENIEYPEQLLPEIAKKLKPEHICRTYLIKSYTDMENLMEILGKKWGRLHKGGDVDKRAVARKLLEDYVRGHLPHFEAPHSVEEIEQYKDSIKAEREHWKNQTDSELIKFVNRQKLSAAGQEFKFLNTEPEAIPVVEEDNENAEDYSESEEEPYQRPVRKIKEIPKQAMEFANQENSGSDVQSFGSEDVDAAVDDDAPQRKAKKPVIIQKQSKKRARHAEGVKRATRILQSKNTELLRAAASSLVDEKDLKMIAHPKKLKVKKERQGGFKHQKTGTHFYDTKRMDRKK